MHVKLVADVILCLGNRDFWFANTSGIQKVFFNKSKEHVSFAAFVYHFCKVVNMSSIESKFKDLFQFGYICEDYLKIIVVCIF